MKIILHRINNINELKKIPSRYGVEIDIRAYKDKLILNHEPLLKGDYFDDYLDNFKHNFIIVNIKEAGIEDEVILKLNRKKIKNFFLLDVEFPYIYKAIKKDFKKIAIRFSEYESIETLNNFKNKLDWVWIDTFNKFPINHKNIESLNYFKKCIVCPERWGRKSDIIKYKKFIKKNNYKIDSVMTSKKFVHLWEDKSYKE
jgi:hypothetical protein